METLRFYVVYSASVPAQVPVLVGAGGTLAKGVFAGRKFCQ